MRLVGLGPDDIAVGLSDTIESIDSAPASNASAKLRFDSWKDAAKLYESFAKLSERQASSTQTLVQLVHAVPRPVRALPPANIVEPTPEADASEQEDASESLPTT